MESKRKSFSKVIGSDRLRSDRYPQTLYRLVVLSSHRHVDWLHLVFCQSVLLLDTVSISTCTACQANIDLMSSIDYTILSPLSCGEFGSTRTNTV